MGQSTTARCKKCGHEFEVNRGGGFIFHLLHCNQCGQEKEILFEEFEDLHLRYLKELKGPYCLASRDHDEYVRETYPG